MPFVNLGPNLLRSEPPHEDPKAFEKHSVEKDVAENIKKEFDKKHGSTWRCIVGRNFGNSFFVCGHFGFL
nr:dynein light chain 1, cytoplasmic [Quercus suber]